MAISTCSGCKESFRSNGAFDVHRVGGHHKSPYGLVRRCLTPEEMIRDKHMSKNTQGRWTMGPYTGPERFTRERTISDACNHPKVSKYNTRARF